MISILLSWLFEVFAPHIFNSLNVYPYITPRNESFKAQYMKKLALEFTLSKSSEKGVNISIQYGSVILHCSFSSSLNLALWYIISAMRIMIRDIWQTTNMITMTDNVIVGPFSFLTSLSIFDVGSRFGPFSFFTSLSIFTF